MKYVSTADIPLSDIEIPERLRPINPDWVEALSAAFGEQGQKTPIEVVGQSRGKKYRLVSGGHRCAAARQLGWATIRAEIKDADGEHRDLEIELHEIDENLHRHELNPLDRAVFLGRRKEIYEELHPETKNGAQGGRGAQVNENETVSFAKETADRINLGERTIQRATRIYKGLAPEVRARLAGSHLAGIEGDLYQLTRYSPEQQAEIVDRCLGAIEKGAPPALARVALVARTIEGGAATPKPAHEIETAKLRDSWDRAGKRARTAHLQFLADIGVIETFTVEHL